MTQEAIGLGASRDRELLKCKEKRTGKQYALILAKEAELQIR